MVVFKKKFRCSHGFAVMVCFLLGIAIGSFLILDNLCKIISFTGILIILSFPILVVVLTSFYVVIDGDAVIIKNIVPFIQRKYYIRDIKRCKMIYNPNIGGYHIAFFNTNKYAVYYPLGMIGPEDVEKIAVLLSSKNVMVVKKDKVAGT